MDDATATPELVVVEVQPGTIRFEQVLSLAAQVLAQDRQLTSGFPAAEQSHVLGAFNSSRCVGFLRYLIQVIGAEEGRPRSCAMARRSGKASLRLSASIRSCAAAV
jgi:hypothetical protein